MITAFKIFENNKEPKIGDYVVCYDGDSELKDFMFNNIGQIVKINKKGYGHKNNLGHYLVKYKNYPKELENEFTWDDIDGGRPMRKYEILHFSKNKKELEMFIQMNKYNL